MRLQKNFTVCAWIKKDSIQAEIEACEKLLEYSGTAEKAMIEKEIAALKTALDLMS